MGYWDSFVDMHIVHSFFFSQASCTGGNWATRWPEARERGVKANSLIHHDIGWPVRMHPERFGWWQPGALNVCFEKLIMPELIHWFSNIFYQIFDSRRTWRYLTLDQTIDIHSQYVNWHETFLVHGVVSMVSFLTSRNSLVLPANLDRGFVRQVVGLEECSIMSWFDVKHQCWKHEAADTRGSFEDQDHDRVTKNIQKVDAWI